MSKNRKTVLIIEDDESLREIFGLTLELEGYQVLEAGNGKEALEILLGLERCDFPSCILLDLMMPVLDYKFKFGRIPVIVCSAHGEIGESKQVVLKLSKPIPLETLSKAVNEIVYRGKAGMSSISASL